MHGQPGLLTAIREYLASSPGSVALITDPPTAPIIEAAFRTSSQPLTFIVGRDRNVSNLLDHGIKELLAVSVHDEMHLRRVLETTTAGFRQGPIKITSGLNDVFLRCLARDRPNAAAIPRDAKIPDLPSYALLCTPRSGSTYLTELLSSAGLGRPVEHLRDQEIGALAGLRLGSGDACDLLTEFAWMYQENFIFGTKVISHFLFSLLAGITVPAETIDFIRKHVRVVYLLRRDKVGQAISDYLANSTGVWHVRDKDGAAALSSLHRQTDYEFEHILKSYESIQAEEAKLAEYVRQMNHRAFFYEDLVATPDAVVLAIAAFLGFNEIDGYSAKVMKTGSAVNELMRARFLTDFQKHFGTSPGEYIPEGISFGSLDSDEDPDLQSLRELKEIRLGQYQSRCWHIADYKCRWCDEIGEYIRADQREPIDGEAFVLAFGAAQTFGPYVRKSFVNLLSERLSVPFVNCGVGGAGPDFFSRDEMREDFVALCNKASAVIWQVQSCRMMGSVILPKGRDPKNSLQVIQNETATQFDSERAMVELRRLGRDEDLARHVELARQAWCETIRQLAEQIEVPKILLWLSSRTPYYTERWPSPPGIDGLLGAFPQLVNQQMMDNVSPFFDRCVIAVFPDHPEPLLNRFSKKPTRAVFGGGIAADQHWQDVNDYYPSSVMHGVAAAALEPVIGRILSEPRPHRPAQALRSRASENGRRKLMTEGAPAERDAVDSTTSPAKGDLPDLTKLYDLGLSLFDKFREQALQFADDRGAQLRLVNDMTTFMEANGTAPSVDYDGVDRFARLNDANFRSLWKSSASDIAWLLVHEGLSKAFPKYAVHGLGRDLLLVQQVPKTGSTAVNKALRDAGFLVLYHHADFEFMASLYGLMGFSNQAFQLLNNAETGAPAIFGGHYNLPTAVDYLGAPRDVKGVSFFRDPVNLVSSAIRYVWQQLAEEVPGVIRNYPHLDTSFLRAAFDRLQGGASGDPEVVSAVRAVLASSRFENEYMEPLRKYYTNGSIVTTSDLRAFLLQHSGIKLAPDMPTGSAALEHLLGRPLAVPKANVALLCKANLADAVGGEEALKELLMPYCEQSLEVFGVLTEVSRRGSA